MQIRLFTPEHRGFTLIELLVVVAVISILAAIALPNFLEAQIRARVSRVRADLRTLAMGLESYRVDANRYPPCAGTSIYEQPIFSNPVHQRLIPITSPVAYLTSIPLDPFPPQHTYDGHDQDLLFYTSYDYVEANNRLNVGSAICSGGEWRLCSAGPDLGIAFGGVPVLGGNPNNPPGVDYDPTNGAVSAGDLVRVGAPAPCPGGADNPTNPYRPGILRAPSYHEQF